MAAEDEGNEGNTDLIDKDGLLDNEDLLRRLAIEDHVIADHHRVLILLRFLGAIEEERPYRRGRRRRRLRTNTRLARHLTYNVVSSLSEQCAAWREVHSVSALNLGKLAVNNYNYYIPEGKPGKAPCLSVPSPPYPGLIHYPSVDKRNPAYVYRVA
ncbi:uncharacterized protein NECHADRAFT_89543 [Fusarium vanettenii 77-13-4]|uniref:Uncharacterized protein n=1 Tax=Fusarium vanettenii (strain ATCC MYA-4622 / CBS 123669 / FGSC 9596 / NRRL 45880 / 77-13-4) TaxID=660122 RepID=C7ZRI2_FUSV7|nr:uncharacterized protein NECHADRAFT_89543 [Fusarium vanettenii 77-13-4]EEU33376.1 predicted protein [Fusarium vanettenii 77-13-4]